MVSPGKSKAITMNSEQVCPRCGTGVDDHQALGGICPKCLMGLGLETAEFSLQEAPKVADLPLSEELGEMLPTYDVQEQIGHGGMGAVYRAIQKKLNRTVALKVLVNAADRDESFKERFIREAQALAGLNHPGIVGIFDFGEAGNHYYFAMEFVDGVNLRQAILTKSLAPKEAMSIVEQICQALEYAHRQGVVHRDIKPENILIDRGGRVKITDFGLAKLVRQEDNGFHLTRSDQVMGTPHYMAPEQVERPLSVDHRADLYSLGVVFYELLTGELPLGRFNPPSNKVAIDVRLDQVVLRSLEKEPELRYQTANELETDVHNVGMANPDATDKRGFFARRRRQNSTRPAAPPSRRRSHRRVLSWKSVAIVVLFVGTVGFIAALLESRCPQSVGTSEGTSADGGTSCG